MSIYLNDLLQLSPEQIKNTKIKFNLNSGEEDPIDLYREDPAQLLVWQFWGHSRRTFYAGQLAVGLVRIHGSRWLLFDVSRIVSYSGVKGEVAYAHEHIEAYRKYFGRVIVHFQNNSQTIARNAASVLDACTVVKILESRFDDDVFPGYDEVILSWYDLRRVLPKDAWCTALSNQKAVYLITDVSNGKQYVGSASGEEMLQQRWASYVNNGHGNNKELMKLSPSHIQTNFQYAILEIFKSTTPTKLILEREKWWKRALQTKVPFGYNGNS